MASPSFAPRKRPRVAFFQTMAQQSEKQRTAFQKVAQESINVYLDLLSTPIAFYQKGIDVTRQAAQKAR